MKPHDTFLELAALAIDYPLTTSERHRLDAHLAECPACVRSASALRADALGFADLPPVTLPERRGEEILYAAMHPAAIRRPLRLVAVAALLALLALGSLAVGAELLRRMDEDRLAVVPVPSESPAPSGSPGPSESPRPSAGPSGRLVVTHDGWIETVSPDGSDATRLGEGSDAAWLSAKVIVFFCAQPSPDFLGICTVDPGSPGSVQPLMGDADRPAPAPDGRSIAMHRGTIDVGSTWIIDADGSALRQLSPGAFLRWSPDGAWLAGQPESATFEVAIIGADGTGFRVLAPGYDPAWASSSDQILYASLADGTASLRVVDVASGDAEVLYVAAPGAELTVPAWLPGGIVFVQDGNLWRLDAGESEPAQLTTGLAIQAGSSGGPLSVSHDGRWIAFTTGIGAEARVGIASVDGGWEMLDPGPGAVSQPRWAPEPAAPPTPSGSPGPMDPAAFSWARQGDVPGDLAPEIVGFDGGYVARGPMLPSPGVYFSRDGRAWQAIRLPWLASEPARDPEILGLASSGSQVLAVGGYSHDPCRNTDPGEGPACELSPMAWVTDDGVTWRRSEPWTVPAGADEPEGGTEASVAWAVPGGWEAARIYWVGESTNPLDVWRSADGISWERVAPLGAFGTDRGHGVAVAEDGTRVRWDSQLTCPAGGVCGNRGLLRVSVDGVAWTELDTFPGIDLGITGVAPPIDGGRSTWVVAGTEIHWDDAGGIAAEVPRIWTSSDLSAWTAVDVDVPDEARATITGIAWTQDRLIVVGSTRMGDASEGLTWASTDGSTWTLLAGRQAVGLVAAGPSGVVGLPEPGWGGDTATWLLGG